MREIGFPLRTRPWAMAVRGNQPAMLRGLVHGVILSLAVWLVAGWVTLVLR